MNIQIELQRRPEDYRLDNCVIDVVEEIPHDSFETFQNYPTARYGAITNSLHRLPEDTKDERHCILLLDADGDEGFIVNPHGAEYARYSAFVPNARQLCRLAQYPSLNRFSSDMEKLVEHFELEILRNQKDGRYQFSMNTVSDYYLEKFDGFLDGNLFLNMLSERPEIVEVEEYCDELTAKVKNQFQQLMELLPNDHKAKWFAGAALNTAEQSMASVMSTALSRLNGFLDSELEQILCFDTELDAERFCNEKSAFFVVMPEENPNTFFMVSLIIQQLYREILAVADENGGKLNNRCVFYCDEFGTIPKIESAEMMFSAARSRRLQIVPIIQSFSQLDKNYGKEGAEIIVDNTQITLFGGFAPNSSSAETLSKALGSRTVMSGSISRGKDNPSQSLQMVERALMTPDELKAMPKGEFIVMKTGVHPMKVHLKLFFKWGIEFDEEHPYVVPENGNRRVQYAEKKEIQQSIMEKYHPESIFDAPPVSEKANNGGKPHGDEQQNIFDEVKPLNEKERRKKRGGTSETTEQTMTPPKEQVNVDGAP